MKKIGLYLLAMLSLISLSACKPKPLETTTSENMSSTEEKVQVPDITKMDLFGKAQYTLKLNLTSTGGEGKREITYAVKNSSNYLSILSSYGSYITITKDNITYNLNPTAKTYLTYPATTPDSATSTAPRGVVIIPKNLETYQQSTGKEFINGKEYAYQEFSNDKESHRYYFENDVLKYIKHTDLVNEKTEEIEILQLTDTVDDNLFDIPSDYTESKTIVPQSNRP